MSESQPEIFNEMSKSRQWVLNENKIQNAWIL